MPLDLAQHGPQWFVKIHRLHDRHYTTAKTAIIGFCLISAVLLGLAFGAEFETPYRAVISSMMLFLTTLAVANARSLIVYLAEEDGDYKILWRTIRDANYYFIVAIMMAAYSMPLDGSMFQSVGRMKRVSA